MKTVKFPVQGSVFDYYLDPRSRRFLPWTDRVPAFEMEPDTPVQVKPISYSAGRNKSTFLPVTCRITCCERTLYNTV